MHKRQADGGTDLRPVQQGKSGTQTRHETAYVQTVGRIEACISPIQLPWVKGGLQLCLESVGHRERVESGGGVGGGGGGGGGSRQ